MPNLILRGETAGESIILTPLASLTLEDLKTSLLNILLFVPFGFGLPFITNLRMKRIIVFGALFSIVIELLQLITGLLAKMTFRIADINDVIFNTLGVGIGYLAFIIFTKWVRSMTPKNILITGIIGIVATVAVALYGITLYQKDQFPASFGRDTDKGQSNRLSNEQEGQIPPSGDLCGGTGGIGQIVGTGNNTFTIKRKDGRKLSVTLTNHATIKTSTGAAVASDLKKGDKVTLVGDPNPDGSFTADTVVVCKVLGLDTQ